MGQIEVRMTDTVVMLKIIVPALEYISVVNDLNRTKPHPSNQ